MKTASPEAGRGTLASLPGLRRWTRVASTPVLLLIVATVGLCADDPPTPRPTRPSVKVPEAMEMLWSILKGSDMGPQDGWFHPGEGRYGWTWLADRFDADHDGAITGEELRGKPDLFARLDRDRDGAVTVEDLDWTGKSNYARQTAQAGRLFRGMDVNFNGKISKEEWDAFYDRVSRGKKYLSPDDLKQILTTPTPRQPPPAEKPGQRSSDDPTRWTLLKGLINGEIGSCREGPPVGGLAPEFTLKTQDGRREISLSDSRGKKPVVLIFGSFT